MHEYEPHCELIDARTGEVIGTSRSAERLDYFGVRPCGCVTAWLSEKYATKQDVQEFYVEMAASGREIRRAPLDGPEGWRVRLMTGGCMCTEPKEATA